MPYVSSQLYWTPPTAPASSTLTASTAIQQSAPNGQRLALSISSLVGALHRLRWRVVTSSLARTDGSQIVEILRRLHAAQRSTCFTFPFMLTSCGLSPNNSIATAEKAHPARCA